MFMLSLKSTSFCGIYQKQRNELKINNQRLTTLY